MTSGGWKQNTAMIQLAGCHRHNTYDKEHDMTSVYTRNAYRGPTETEVYLEVDMSEISFLLSYWLSIWGVSFYLYLFAIKFSMYMISLKTF